MRSAWTSPATSGTGAAGSWPRVTSSPGFGSADPRDRRTVSHLGNHVGSSETPTGGDTAVTEHRGGTQEEGQGGRGAPAEGEKGGTPRGGQTGTERHAPAPAPGRE